MYDLRGLKVGDNQEQGKFLRAIGGKAKRKLRLRRMKDMTLLGGLGQMGLVGWSIALPSLIGVFLGWLIDKRLGHGHHSWTLPLFIVGLGVGCISVLFWACKEYKEIDGNKKDHR